MDSDNNWRPEQADQPPPDNMDDGDWRSRVSRESRQKLIFKIVDNLRKHYSFSGQEGLSDLKGVAVRFEERTYNAATSQADYLRRISMKLLAMDYKTQNTTAGSTASNPGSSSRNPIEPVPQNMQYQGQSGQMPSATNQPQVPQQMLGQNLPGNIASASVQSSAGLESTLPPVSGMNHSPLSTVISQTSGTQSMGDASQDVICNSLGKGIASNMLDNQKQFPRREQVTPGHQQLQQQYLYKQQQLIKQKQLEQGIIPNSLMQSHIHQNLRQPNLMQSAHQTGISTSNAMLQQPLQSMLRKQTQQPHPLHQQQMAHQPMVSSQPHQPIKTSQPQQPLMGQQINPRTMQSTQLLGQQNISDMPQQQQRLMTQQNNISSLQQPQLIDQQTNITNIHQRRMGHLGTVSALQQQLHGTQSSNSGIQANQHEMNAAHQSKVSIPQENRQPGTSLIANQGQHLQPQQPQIVSQIHSQSAQLQQQIGMNQQQQDIQQRLQPSSTIIQPHNTGDQQKQSYQSQRVLPEASSTSTDSVSQTGHANSSDWQEEAYRKITSLKDSYLPELSDVYQKLSLKLEQLDSLPQQPKADQLEKLKMYKSMSERYIKLLHFSKSQINPALREKLPLYEKQMINFLNSIRSRRPGHIPPPMQSVQHAQSQDMQAQSYEKHMNPSLQSANIQGHVIMQQNSSSLQQNPMSSQSAASIAQQNMTGSVQPGWNVDAGQGSGLASLQKGVGGFLQQSGNAPQQTNINALTSRIGASLIQPSISNLQSNSSVNQQHAKEQQILQSNQPKHQFHQRQMQQQIIQKQQLLQQQQLHHQSKQQQTGPMSTNQLSQLQQMADVNDMNIRQGLGVKPGIFSQRHAAAAGQRSVYNQQMKSGVSYSMFSPQIVQTSSPQSFQNSPSQVDQQNTLSSLSKAGTPLQSANSSFVVPSPATPMAPSPMPGGSENLNSNVSSLATAGNIGVQQSAIQPVSTQPLAIGTPGISASPLLTEFSNQDIAHGTASVVLSDSRVSDQPIDRLVKAVKSIKNEAFTASMKDIGSVLSMIDRIGGSAPGNGSRAAVGEDFAALTKCRLQAKNSATQEESDGSKKVKRFTSSMPMAVVSTADGSGNDSLKQLVGSELPDLESTTTSRAKRPRTEINHSILKEIREINQRLIDTTVDISDKDVNPASEGSGVVVKCSYNAVALSPDWKSLFATSQPSPIQPLRLLVPSEYPECSPVLLDNLPVNASETEDLSMKAKLMFSRSLRTLSEPTSLGEIARTWDFCARTAINEYAQARGGGSFSSKYGSWETVLSN